MTRRPALLTAILLILAILPAKGQSVPRARDFRVVCDTLSARLQRRTTVRHRLSVTKVEASGKTLDLTFNADLSYYPWHTADVEWFKGQLAKEFEKVTKDFALNRKPHGKFPYKAV